MRLPLELFVLLLFRYGTYDTAKVPRDETSKGSRGIRETIFSPRDECIESEVPTMRCDETRRDETRHERQARLSRQEVGAYKLTREGSSKERDRVGSCGYGARKHREEGKARDSRAKNPRWLNKMKCME